MSHSKFLPPCLEVCIRKLKTRYKFMPSKPQICNFVKCKRWWYTWIESEQTVFQFAYPTRILRHKHTLFFLDFSKLFWLGWRHACRWRPGSRIWWRRPSTENRTSRTEGKRVGCPFAGWLNKEILKTLNYSKNTWTCMKIYLTVGGAASVARDVFLDVPT